jgi:nicotinate-nucleotide adenylyltransferase
MGGIGIFGGSFTPVHIGHLLAGRAAAEAFGLRRVLLLPCSVSPFKLDRAGLAPGGDRLEMVRLSVAGDPLFEPCGLDVSRGGVSYAVETVRALRDRYPGERLYFIMGTDALRELHHWHKGDEMLALCDVITLRRPGADAPLKAGELDLPAGVRARVLSNVVGGRLCDISSSEIRRRIAEGLPIRYLVTDAVEAYIRSRELYVKEGGPLLTRNSLP